MSDRISARVRRIAAHAVALGSAHLHLAGLEWQDQFSRHLRMLVWLAAGIVCGGMVILLVSLSVVAAYWDTPQRVTVVLVLAALFLIAVLAIALGMYRALHHAPVPFASLVEELKRDADMFGFGDDEPTASNERAPHVQERP